MSGPIGQNEIIDNENFNRQYSVNIIEDRYLQVSKGSITYLSKSDENVANDSSVTSVPQKEGNAKKLI